MRWNIDSPDYTEVTFEQNPAWNFIVPGGWDEKELLEMYPYKAARFKSKSKITQMDYQGSEEDVLNTNVIRTIHFYKPKTLWERVMSIPSLWKEIKYKYFDNYYSLPVWIQVIAVMLFSPFRLIKNILVFISVFIGMVLIYPVVLVLDMYGKHKVQSENWKKTKKVSLRLLAQGDSGIGKFRHGPPIK